MDAFGEEVLSELVSEKSARHDCGVVIDPESFVVDKAETERLRK
jgi:hypothetical protein